MRLLNVETMKLETFVDEMMMPAYTILSHCWGEDEVSFQDFQEGNCHHLKGFQKIESCCRRTRLEQYRYTWIDTCCINKDSSAELSEAINSMFRWYEHAAICYVYMEDVEWDWSDDTWFDESTEEMVLDTPADSADMKDKNQALPKANATAFMSRRSSVYFHGVDLLGAQASKLPAIRRKQPAALITDKYPDSCKILQVLPPNEYQSLKRVRVLSCRPDSPNTLQFRLSRWFTRGWTLQELIAPAHVVFFDHAWRDIGSKITLSNLIFDITGIDKLVLCHDYLHNSTPYEAHTMLQETLQKFSVATRMYWASRRTTSRVEDMAYCLLGLFDINMPLMYGEGARAFYRLQLEIMQEEPDPSILLFGGLSESHTDLLAPSPAVFSPEFSEPRYSEDIATKKNAKLRLDPTKTSVSVEALTIDLKSLIGPLSSGSYKTSMEASSSTTRIASDCRQLISNARQGYYHANDAPVAILTMTRGEALGLLLRPKYPNPSPTTSWFRECRHTFRFQYDVGTWPALKSRTFTMQLRKPIPPPLRPDYHMPMFMEPSVSHNLPPLFQSSGTEPTSYVFIFRSKNPDTHPPFAIVVFLATGKIKCFALPSNPPTETLTSDELHHFFTLMQGTQGNLGSSALYTDTRQVLVSASTRPSPDSLGLLLVTMERKGPQTHEYPVVKYDTKDLPCWGYPSRAASVEQYTQRLL